MTVLASWCRGFAVIARNAEVDGDEPYDNDYDEIYRDTAGSGGPPWVIGGPQPALARVLDDGVKGPKVLDVGCGTGDLAIALARRGYEVTAIDISRVAIDMARAKAAAEGLTVHFEVADATDLSLPSAPFDSVFDSGLLHSLRRRGGGEADDYLELLPGLAAPGATVFVLAVSREAGQGWDLTEELLRAGFAEPVWVDTQVEEIDVAAEVGGRELSLPGFLLRTVRASTSSSPLLDDDDNLALGMSFAEVPQRLWHLVQPIPTVDHDVDLSFLAQPNDRDHVLHTEPNRQTRLDLPFVLDALQGDRPRLGQGRGLLVGHAAGHVRQDALGHARVLGEPAHMTEGVREHVVAWLEECRVGSRGLNTAGDVRPEYVVLWPKRTADA
jgi:SAM-dependent methyltransferase